MPVLQEFSSDVTTWTRAQLQTIDDAINERAVAFGISGVSMSTPANQNIQDKSYWNTRQSKIGQIVQTLLGGSYYGTILDDLSGFATTSGFLVPYTSVQTFWGQVNTSSVPSHQNPRRRTTMTGYLPGSSGYAGSGWATSGSVQADDIIGSWLPNDLINACQLLNRVIKKQTGTSNHVLNKVPDATGYYDIFMAQQVEGQSNQSAARNKYNSATNTSLIRSVDDSGWKDYVVQNSGFWLNFWQYMWDFDGSTLINLEGNNEGGLAKISGLSSRAHTYKIYAAPSMLTIQAPRDPTHGHSSTLIYKSLNHGSVAQGTLMQIGATTGTTTATSHSHQCMNTTSEAYFDSTVPMQTELALGPINVYGYNLPNETYWLINYAFTYT